MKPACPKCSRFYRPKKNGYFFIESMPKPGLGRAPSGTEAPEQWEPYKLWCGDLWVCDGCGHEIIIGALQPVNEHYKPDFKSMIERVEKHQGAIPRINDC